MKQTLLCFLPVLFYTSACSLSDLDSEAAPLDYYQVTLPDTEVVWQHGSTETVVSWETVFKPLYANIDLYKDGELVAPIVSGLENSGIYAGFQVEPAWGTGDGFQVRVTNDEFDRLVSFSAEFTIVDENEIVPSRLKPAVIVTVPGLSFVNTISGFFGVPAWDDREQYLQEAVHGMDLLGQVDPGDVYAYSWDGNAWDTDERLPELKALLQNKYDEAVDEDKLFIILSHSWGTMLSFHSLLDLGSAVEVDHYSTLSSPIGSVYYYDEDFFSTETAIVEYVEYWWDSSRLNYSLSNEVYPSAGSWSNVWCWGDLISGKLPGSIPNLKNYQCDEQDPAFGDDDFRGPAEAEYYHDLTSLNPELATSFNGFTPVNVNGLVRKQIIDTLYR